MRLRWWSSSFWCVIYVLQSGDGQHKASQHNWGLCLPCSNLSTCLASLVRCLPNFIFPFVLLIDRDPLQRTTLEMTFIWWCWFWKSGDDNDENINIGTETIHTVADKKNVAFSHQNNHFGLNKSIERMSRIYNRIFNG